MQARRRTARSMPHRSHRARHPRGRVVAGTVALAAVLGGGVAIASGSSGGDRPQGALLTVGSPAVLPTSTAASLSATAPAATLTGGGAPAATASAPTAAPPVPSTPLTAPATAAAGSPAGGSSLAPAKGVGGTPASAPAKTDAAPAATLPSDGDAVQQVLATVNQARAGQGLAPLSLLAGLNASAAQHNSTMAGGCGLSHQCSGELAVGGREKAQGVSWSSCGENIGEGGPASSDSAIAATAVELTQSMLAEQPPNDGHRRNILSSSFTRVGIAVNRDASGTVWLTQDFAN